MVYEKYAVNFNADGRDIRAEVTVKEVKRLSVSIKGGKVCVNAPLWYSKATVIRFIQRNSLWIKKHLENYEKADEERSGSVYLLGKKYRLVVVSGEEAVVVIHSTIYVSAPENKAQEVFMRWWVEREYRFLHEAVENALKICGKELNITAMPTIKIVNVNSFWGKCFWTENVIKFSAGLFQADEESVIGVVYHELTHYKYHDHQKEFHRALQRFYPNSYSSRRKLNNFSNRNFPPKFE